MMETPLDQLKLVIDEFKAINGDKSLVDTFSEKFRDDWAKLTAYLQLGKSEYSFLILPSLSLCALKSVVFCIKPQLPPIRLNITRTSCSIDWLMVERTVFG